MTMMVQSSCKSARVSGSGEQRRGMAADLLLRSGARYAQLFFLFFGWTSLLRLLFLLYVLFFYFLFFFLLQLQQRNGLWGFIWGLGFDCLVWVGS